ncbi:ethanolamine ammonia-lyase subunit EutC [Spirosoma endbachense]|uniref:Ethanolamine ammonia-lyase small subunit n=1 Tax=Spirosoma endbachense TaxID=2666025 RepID=A0A6P1W4B0_9BACT|nr:ethanolamine ammonia-lyase subunit EutC [Spirosoma endbachense]QHV99152.1 ethanolamine ammonia-lyase subunit EutC [Spirosoma endbachense]
MNKPKKIATETDDWQALKSYTAARIALGRTGVSIPLRESLQFNLAHAHAKDAVYSCLDHSGLQEALADTALPIYSVYSQAANRDIYLQRPDLGRLLANESARQLHELNASPSQLSIIIADGLSANAVNTYAPLVVRRLIDTARLAGYTFAPITLVEQGRVAISDDIGHILQAQLVIMLIGERPGLSSFDSMGAYLTYAPIPGLTDERRNCLSNIRDQGLPPAVAVSKLMWLVDSAFRLQLTGVSLKDTDGSEPDRLSIG